MLIYQFQPCSLQVLLQIWCQSPLQQLKHWSLYSEPKNKSIIMSTITMHTWFINIIIFLINFIFSFQFTANLSRRYSAVQFSRSFMSDSLWPHGLQHARPPCPSPTPGVHSNSCPLSRWCHPIISSSVVPFSRPQSFPASGSFQMTQFFTAGGQSIGASVLALVL